MQKVLFILGTTRCGSTILENVLGSTEGFFAAGEIHMLARALLGDYRCGCGKKVTTCDIWGHLRSDPAVGMVDPAEIWSWQQRETRILHTPRLLSTRSWPVTGRPMLDRYIDFLSRLYPALAQRTESRVLVDSSKSPAAALILSNLHDIDLYVLHLVRDPRGVAYSWRRGRPSGATVPGYQPGAVRTTGRWVATNLLGDIVRRRLDPDHSMMLRYEDFVQSPASTTRRIAAFVGERHASLPFVNDQTATLGSNHIVSGNRSRFASGAVEVRIDDEWRHAAPVQRAIVSILTLPWLGRYRYTMTGR